MPAVIENIELSAVDLTTSNYGGGLAGSLEGGVKIQNNLIKDINVEITRRIPDKGTGHSFQGARFVGLAIGKIGQGAKVIGNRVNGQMKYVVNEIYPTYFETNYGIRPFINMENPSYAGGLIGGMDGFPVSPTYKSEIEILRNTVKAKLNLPEHSYVGGIIGVRSHALIEDFYVEIDLLAKTNFGGAIGQSSFTRSSATQNLSGVDLRSTDISRGVVRGSCYLKSCIDSAGAAIAGQSSGGALMGSLQSNPYIPSLGIAVQDVLTDVKVSFASSLQTDRTVLGGLIGNVSETLSAAVYSSEALSKSEFFNVNFIQRSYLTSGVIGASASAPLQCAGNMPTGITSIAGCSEQLVPQSFSGEESLLAQRLQNSGNWNISEKDYPSLK